VASDGASSVNITVDTKITVTKTISLSDFSLTKMAQMGHNYVPNIQSSSFHSLQHSIVAWYLSRISDKHSNNNIRY